MDYLNLLKKHRGPRVWDSC